MLKNKLFDNVLKDFDTGYWELDPASAQIVWSKKFFSALGYSKKDVTPSYAYFIEQLLHKEDASLFAKNFEAYRSHNQNFKQHIRILNKEGAYQLFRCATNDELPVNIQSLVQLIFFFEVKLEPEKTFKKDIFYYRETAEMTSTGSWYVDFNKKQSYWDFETRRILEYPENYIPSLKNSAKYYADDSKQQAADLFFKCAMSGTAFNTEIKMLTSNGREFWVKAIGKPVYGKDKEIIGIRGVFQDIDEAKRKELRLQKSMDIIASQNSKLFNFAHIVSHNLRSHTSNLSLLVQLIDDLENPKEREEVINEVRHISYNLNTTIDHLNEIVTIHTNNQQERVPVRFSKALELVTNGIGHIINSTKTEIIADFTLLPEIPFIPAYMESIFLNLITNAIKYKHPDRKPVVRIKSYTEEGANYLKISDNGSGIDMKANKSKIFGMYKTFHANEDAVGIGLFITRNQIESMGGTIKVESEVGVGTTFTIQF
ncbi:ATP-binding protein [Aquimarina sp. 2-A2]|uniref:PAS domain-containing sensor histidine kinase n=1 Tax=Aquimarina sp. 2-A2 TaxID=3382644 RepID=UPI00387F2A62